MPIDEICEDLQDDREIVLLAVKNAGQNIWDASERLKNDEEIVLEAIKDFAICFDDEQILLRDNEEFIYKASKVNFGIIEYATERVKNHKEFMTKLLEEFVANIDDSDYDFANFIDEYYEENPKYLYAITKAPVLIKYVPEEIINRDFALSGVYFNGDVYQYLTEEFASDEEIALQAIENEAENIIRIPEELISEEFIEKAYDRNSDINDYRWLGFKNAPDKQLFEFLDAFDSEDEYEDDEDDQIANEEQQLNESSENNLNKAYTFEALKNLAQDFVDMPTAEYKENKDSKLDIIKSNLMLYSHAFCNTEEIDPDFQNLTDEIISMLKQKIELENKNISKENQEKDKNNHSSYIKNLTSEFNKLF